MLKSLRKDGIFDKCPECNSIGVLRRSRAHNYYENMIIKSCMVNIYRCRECGWRGIKSNFSLKKISPKVILLYLFFILFVAVFVRFIIQRFVMR